MDMLIILIPAITISKKVSQKKAGRKDFLFFLLKMKEGVLKMVNKKSKKIDIMIIKQQEYSDLLVKYKYSLYTEEAKKLKREK